MATHNYGHGGRRKGQRNMNVERQMDQNWRTASRSGSPSSSLVNGSPHTSYKREPTPSPAEFEYRRNVEFLKREWKKFQTEHRSRKDAVTEFVLRDPNIQDAVTEYVLRDPNLQEFQAFDLDAFLKDLHHQRQQPQQ